MTDAHPAPVATLVLARDPGWGDGPAVTRWRRELESAVVACGAGLVQADAPVPVVDPGGDPTGGQEPAAGTAAEGERAAAAPEVVAAAATASSLGLRLRAAAAALRDPVPSAVRPAGVPAADAAAEAHVAPPGPANGSGPAAGNGTSRPSAGPEANGAADPTPGADEDTVEQVWRSGPVLAEGEAAAAALAGRVPPSRLWCLVLPAERSAWGDPAPWADGLRELAPRLAGLVTDSEDARDVLERVLSPRRLPVHLLPPLLPDAPAAPPAGAPDGTPAPYDAGQDPDPDTDTFGPVAQLELWHALSRGAAPPVPAALQFAAARFPADAPPPPADVEPWGEPAPAGDAEPDRGAWTEQCRRATVRELLAWVPGLADATGARPRPVALVGFDLKFLHELTQRLSHLPHLRVAVDEWPGAGQRNEGRTEEVVRAARTLVAEWARPNAAWLSRVKRPDQQLVVRLHRFELDSPYPAQIQIDRVDAVVYIAPALGRRIVDELGWPEQKLLYVPNFVDLDWLDRPKHPDARFTLAMMGAVPRLKRLDLALDLLRAVRARDPRFSLAVRTQLPWTSRYAWRDAGERRYFQRQFERVETDPLLRGAVRFDAFGRDVAAWLRGVGHVLSLSDIEGSHTALSEGMASGAVPVVRRWPGVDEMYDAAWIQESTAQAADLVLQDADPQQWQHRSERARAQMRRSMSPDDVVGAWDLLLQGRYREAAACFGRPEHVGLHRGG